MMFLTKVGKNQLTAREILTDPILCLAFGFGSGLAKKAPGTFGTLAAVPIYIALAQTNIWIYSVVSVLCSVVGIWICGIAAEKLGEHDFGGIVWDEIAGLLITMWFVVFSWQNLLLGFILFRAFDIIKPWPIKWIDQKVSGGFGIMLDDVIAGVFAGLVLMYLI
ncbi:phosphatidylglycerophosphatase A [Bathymodiolus platifrons methanotrophic gill symbiont]|uniref:phosphatidylglycerophosphatase A family protein n=1 Tax=Bathymodiolus platifrons methanotrophic gill symbiont TaxID=113268 RepID=UPI000B685D7F|nr:phosphatidylglycerophosphatase A [Bathymodiolus platifrons methanotrophic gill symbiont]MCK5869061.1 phosphatidylglycerophosphatase A [Methyloprofundus sp.]GAW85333.1 phosphatidylglycerophosphatase A [Bathymodiolus platifrons methanotrophic gill symbiont]GFO73762.1 phosphatidylglycerophosphatase A [Bathymodiolus platifrons methanotrophic gill symbiont]